MADKTYQIEDFRWLVRTVFRDIHEGISRKVWILGAGASIDSGIEPAAKLAHRWSCELLGLKDITTTFDECLARWPNNGYLKELLAKRTATESSAAFLAKCYFAVYAKRFQGNPHEGYAYLRKCMEGKTPSVGYLVLAQLIGDGSNLVVTVNFDNLVADALFLMGKQLPLIVDHEDLAHFANPTDGVTLICKIHRDLLKAPLNTEEEMRRLSEKWKDPLDAIFKNFAPIFIGYGGNDQTLMGYLKGRCEPLRSSPIWLHYTDENLTDETKIRAEVPDEIGAFLSRNNGTLIPYRGFDSLMYFAQGDLDLPKVLDVYGDRTHKLSDTLKTSLSELAKKTGEGRGTNPVAEETVAEVSGSETRTLQDWILMAFSKDHLEDRLIILRQAQVVFPDEAILQNYASGALSNLGRYEEALQAADEAIKIAPKEYVAYTNRAFALNRLGRYEEALQTANEAIKIAPKEYVPYTNRASALNRLGRYEEALQAADEAIKIAPEEGAGYTNRAFALNRLGRYEEALQAADEANKVAPKEYAGYTNRASALNRLGRYEEALQAADEAIKIAPEEYAAYTSRASALNRLGRYEEALQAADEAIKIAPEEYAGYTNRAAALSELGRYEEALQAADEAIKVAPKEYAGYTNRASALNRLGRYEEALQAADEAIKIAPEDAFGHRHRGNSLRLLSRLDEASQDIGRAIELNPTFGNAYVTLASLMAQQGDLEQSLNTLQRAKELRANELPLALSDPEFEPLREDPRFKKILGIT
jgi:tetratricopeptide (TPR) repeat protein